MHLFTTNTCFNKSCRLQFRHRRDLIHHIQLEHIDYSIPVSPFSRADEDCMINPNRVSRYFRTLPRRKPVAVGRAPKYDPDRLPGATASEGIDLPVPSSSLPLSSSNPKIEVSSRGRRTPSRSSSSSNNGKMQFVYCQVTGCGRRYKGERSLRQHIKVAHSGMKPKVRKEPILLCQYCNKSYRTASGLNSHMKSKNHQIASSVRRESDMSSMNFSEGGIDWHSISLASFGNTTSVETLPMTSQVTVGTSAPKREPQLFDSVRPGRRQHQFSYGQNFRPAESPPNVRKLLANRAQVLSPAQTSDSGFTLPGRTGMASSAVGGYDRSAVQRSLSYAAAPTGHDMAQRPINTLLQPSYRFPNLSNDCVPMEDKQLE